MKRLTLIAAIGCTCIATAHAEVYRCVVNGRTVYTDIACRANAQAADLPKLSTVQAGPSADLSGQYDAEASRQRAAVKQSRAADADTYAAKKANAERIRKGVVDGRVVAGMTPDQVERILNVPTQITDQGGPHERWLYKNGREQQTVTFKDGVVASATSGSSRKRK